MFESIAIGLLMVTVILGPAIAQVMVKGGIYALFPSVKTWRWTVKKKTFDSTAGWMVEAQYARQHKGHAEILMTAAQSPAEIFGYINHFIRDLENEDRVNFLMTYKDQILPMLPGVTVESEIYYASSSMYQSALTFHSVIESFRDRGYEPTDQDREFYNAFIDEVSVISQNVSWYRLSYNPHLDTVQGVFSKPEKNAEFIERMDDSFKRRVIEYWNLTYPESADLPETWKIEAIKASEFEQEEAQN